MDRTLYSDYPDKWDEEVFRRILVEKINADSCCLDYGAGRGYVAQMNFKGVAKFVAGIDPDEAVLGNPHLDEAKLLDLRDSIIPYEDNSFDVVFSDNVLEHVRDPVVVFREIARVLKPGGAYLAKTPNRWHYVSLLARLTPEWFHEFYNRLRGRSAHDTFPTVYRCNSRAAVIKYAQQAGLEVKRVVFIEGRPEYLRLSSFTYLLGLLYERLVNSSRLFEPLRCVMVFELEKGR
jgi:SAM-dependent methyltransferase